MYVSFVHSRQEKAAVAGKREHKGMLGGKHCLVYLLVNNKAGPSFR